MVKMRMLKRRLEFVLTLLCLLVSWLDFGLSAPVIVTLLDTSPHYYYFQGAVANFGNQLDSQAYYYAVLAIPPGNPDLCEYPGALENVAEATDTASRRTQPARVALLVQRGNCSFLRKALIALQISRNSSRWDIEFVLVYNNNKTESTTLFTPSSNATEQENKELQDLGVVFLSTSSGTDILQQVELAEQAQNASAVLQAPGFDHWKFQIAVQQPPPDRGGNPPPPNSNGAGGQPQSSGGGEAAPTFYWFRFVLFSVLILSPCLRAGYLWYAGGGRLRWRYNDQGRVIGIQYIAPVPYWYGATFIPAARQSEVTPCLTEEQVRSLPIITYQQPQQSSRPLVDENDDVEEEHVIPADVKDPKSDEHKDEEIGQSAPASSLLDAQQDNEIAITPNSQSTLLHPQYTTSCTTCSICIDDFRPGEQLRLLPLCRHAFHTDCIMPWLTERQGCCPLCKSSVLEAQENANEESSNGLIELPTRPSSSTVPTTLWIDHQLSTVPSPVAQDHSPPAPSPQPNLPTVTTDPQTSILPIDLDPEQPFSLTVVSPPQSQSEQHTTSTGEAAPGQR